MSPEPTPAMAPDVAPDVAPAGPPAARRDAIALTVRALGVRRTDRDTPVLHEVAFNLRAGEAVGLVGPSGAGKTTLALALTGLLPEGAHLTPESEIRLGDTRLDALPASDWPSVRGRRLALVAQEPMEALHPALRVGTQLAEAGRWHGLDAHETTRRAHALLEALGFDRPARIAARFAHELSGGQRQRVLLAMAMLPRPAVLIADEPTTALDPARREAVLDALARLRETHGTALLLISHDHALVRARCDAVLAMAAGGVAPVAPATLDAPPRPTSVTATATTTTAAITTATPVASGRGPDEAPLLRVQGLTVGHRARSAEDDAGPVFADLSFDLARGEVLGVVGPSGAGKTTLAHAILQLLPARAGTVAFDGVALTGLRDEALRRMRRRIQLVAQDAGASLPPHRTAEAAVAEGLLVHGLARGAEARRRARALLDEVGFPTARAGARCDALSAGERQRVALARALAPAPDCLICDEPLAALDPVRRAQVLALLERWRDERGLALLLIAHDPAAIARMAPRVLAL